jgi:hypothetical protein
MPTECSTELFEFPRVESRVVVGGFDGGRITSDAGLMLLERADRRIGLTKKLVECFEDRRDPLLIEHNVMTLLRQRIYGIAAGYDDLNGNYIPDGTNPKI